jgi:hypothetical protein
MNLSPLNGAIPIPLLTHYPDIIDAGLHQACARRIGGLDEYVYSLTGESVKADAGRYESAVHVLSSAKSLEDRRRGCPAYNSDS